MMHGTMSLKWNDRFLPDHVTTYQTQERKNYRIQNKVYSRKEDGF